ncbi:MAG: hypothetical protein AAF449_04740 [Myxococcota bacterium]
MWQQGSPPTRMPETERPHYLDVLLFIIPFLEALLLGIALYLLGFAEGGLLGWAKLLIFVLAAYLVAWAVYRMAIEFGVPLAVSGVKVAAAASIVGVLTIGSSFFLGTAPGLVIPQVEEGSLLTHNDDLSVYTQKRILVAEKSAEYAPQMQGIAEGLAKQHKAEVKDGGAGPIAKVWEALHGRANGLSVIITASLGVRQATLDEIAALEDRMAETLADETQNIWDRRAAFRKQHNEMLGLLTELDAAMPVSLIKGYAEELDSGALVPDRAEATANMNQVLAGYAKSLKEALASQQGVSGPPPAFPKKSGVLDTLSYAGDAAPVFLLTIAKVADRVEVIQERLGRRRRLNGQYQRITQAKGRGDEPRHLGLSSAGLPRHEKRHLEGQSRVDRDFKLVRRLIRHRPLPRLEPRAFRPRCFEPRPSSDDVFAALEFCRVFGRQLGDIQQLESVTHYIRSKVTAACPSLYTRCSMSMA